MADFASDVINIPRERVAVLIGPKGTVKRRIEKETGVKLNIDSANGQVEIVRYFDAKDQVAALKASDIVKAIARGFPPSKAIKLLSPDVYFELVDLTEFAREKSLERVRSRIIGKEGKSRSYIMKMTGTEIVIYGKTVSIIGDVESIQLAKEAITKLIFGSQHSTVFRFLEKHKMM